MEEKMNEYYAILMQFTHGTTPCRIHLIRRFSEKLLDSAMEMGYIVQVGNNSYNEPIYAITQKGKEKRDN